MERLEQFLLDNKDTYPKYLNQYLPIIQRAKDNLQEYPDTSVDCIKSIWEGFARTIRLTLDSEFDAEKFKTMPIAKIVKDSLEKMENDKIFKIKAYTQQLVNTINGQRNLCGEISHGRQCPKSDTIDADLAKILYDSTDVVLPYILNIFLQRLEKDVKYEDNEEFNMYLDEEYKIKSSQNQAIPTKILYSKALFNQDKVAYTDQLEEFNNPQDIKK